MIIEICILLICFFLILKILKNHEDFTTKIQNPITNRKNHGLHTKVNPNQYHDYFGPTCLTTCLAEHVQKINWEASLEKESEYARENILQYNRDNIKENYCHKANTKINNSDIKNCSSTDCNNSCGSDLYSHCEIEGDFCRESSLNYLTSNAKLFSTNCSGDKDKCIDKYWKNILSIKDVYDLNAQS